MSEELAPEQIKLIHKLNVFKIKGRDKRGRKILRIIGKNFPGKLFVTFDAYYLLIERRLTVFLNNSLLISSTAKSLNVDLLKKYLEVKVFPKLERPFVVVYIHTDVDKSENFPGISALRSAYEAIPINVKQYLEAVYFVHPDLQSRLFLATFGRFIFTGG